MLNVNCKKTTMIVLFVTTCCVCCQDMDTAKVDFTCNEQATDESGDDFVEEFLAYVDYTSEDVLGRVTGTWNGEITLHGETGSESFSLTVEPYLVDGRNPFRFHTPADLESDDDWGICAERGIDVRVVVEATFGDNSCSVPNVNVDSQYLNTYGKELYTGSDFPDDPLFLDDKQWTGIPILNIIIGNEDLSIAFLPNNKLYFARFPDDGATAKWTEASLE